MSFSDCRVFTISGSDSLFSAVLFRTPLDFRMKFLITFPLMVRGRRFASRVDFS